MSFLSWGTMADVRRSMQQITVCPIEVLIPAISRASWWWSLRRAVLLAMGVGRLDADLMALIVTSIVGFRPLGTFIA